MTRPEPTGEIVFDWTQSGHRFRVEKLDPPVMKGAGLRHYRLWHGDEPAGGGQWHYDLDGARCRANYVTQCYDGARIRFLENEVATLRARLARMTAEKMHPGANNSTEDQPDLLTINQ